MKTMLQKNPTLGYLGILVVLSAFPYTLMVLEGTKDSPWVLLLMWIPALSALLARKIRGESLVAGLGWNIFPKIAWVLACALIPLAVDIINVLISINLGFGQFNTSLVQFSDGMISVKKVALLFGAQFQPVIMFVANFILSYWLGALIYMVGFALGEEYGWRGYLQEKLIRGFGMPKGLIILGIVWGYWHLPGVILLGLNYPEYRFLGGFVLMPVMMIVLSIVFGLLYLRFQNIWIPAILHGALNVSAGMSNKLLIPETKNTLAVDIIWIVCWITVALLTTLLLSRYTASRLSLPRLADERKTS